MVKVFKESHEKDVERLVPDHRCEIGWKETHDLQNVPKHTVVWMKGLTSPVCSSLLLCVWVWVCGLSSCFRWWPGFVSCADRTGKKSFPVLSVHETNQTEHGLWYWCWRHSEYTETECVFVGRNQKTSNLENHYDTVTGGTEHKKKNLKITWQECIISTDKRGWDLQQIGGLHCFTHLSFPLSQQKKSHTVTSSLSNDLFERIGFCVCPRTMTNSTNS